MARRRSVWLATVAVGALIAAVGVLGASAAPPTGADASAVTQWNLIAVNTLIGLPPPAGGAAPSSQISLALAQGGVYDAVNAITPKHYRPHLRETGFGNAAWEEAAVSPPAELGRKNSGETV